MTDFTKGYGVVCFLSINHSRVYYSNDSHSQVAILRQAACLPEGPLPHLPL